MYIIVHEDKRLAICGADAFERLRFAPFGARLIRVSDGKVVAKHYKYDIFDLRHSSAPAGKPRSVGVLTTARPAA